MKKTILITLLNLCFVFTMQAQDFYSIVVKQNKTDSPLKLGIRGEADCEECGKITFLSWISNLEFESPMDRIMSQTRDVKMVDGKERSTYSIMLKASDRDQVVKILGDYIEDYSLTVAAIEAGSRRDFIIEVVDEPGEDENLGSFFINTVPENANIVIKGEEDIQYETPFTITDRIPGRYYLKMEKFGFKSEEFAINIKKGMRLDTIIFLEEDLSALNNLGSFHLNTQPEGAYISIKGESGFVAQTPYTINRRPGTYVITLEKPSFKPVEIDVEIERGTQSDMTVKLLPEEAMNQAFSNYKDNPVYKMHSRKQAFWLGASLLSAGGTGYFIYSANNKYNQYKESTDISEIESLKSEVQLNDKLTYVFVGLTAFCLVEYTIHTIKKGKIVKELSFNVTGNGLQLAYTF